MRLLLLLALAAVYLSLSDGKVMVCYFSSWAVYRPDEGKFDIEDVDPTLCTHLIYAFAGLSGSKIKALDPFNDLCENYGKCGFDRFTNLTARNPNVKTLLGVGGWNEGSTKYSSMAADPSKRATFVDSVITMLKDHGFDGLDMDWEYPTQRGGKPDDYTNYVSLLKDLNTALHAEGMILTAAVSAGKATIDPAYNVPAVAEQLDIINLMSYDLHGSWEEYTHHHSCLYGHPNDTGDNIYLNQDFAVNYWIEKGAPKEKLAMGIPLYGRTWKLSHPEEHGFYAPATQPGAAGPYTREPGFMGYNEICDFQQKEDWTIVHDPAMHEPYSYSLSHAGTSIWVSYEDVDSVALKAQYIMDNDLGGAMVWSVETDDFHAKCHGMTFPLMTTIVDVLSGGIYTKPTTQPPPPTTTWDPSRSTPVPSVHCTHPGPNADPQDCSHYWECSQGLEGWDEYEYHCDPSTLFNPQALICDWKDSVCALEGNPCPNDCPQ